MDKLPFYLSCLFCDAGSGIASQEEAESLGWTRIEDDMEECPNCFIGVCPACKHRLPQGQIRLACMNCDRSDFDGITPAQLQQAIENGWQDISEVQSYEESMREIPLDVGDPSIFDWWTHLGLCSDCARHEKA